MHFVSDCRVLPGAEYDTDHQLLCLTYHLPQSVARRRIPRPAGRYAVENHCPGSADDDTCVASCHGAAYRELLRGRLESWPADGGVEDKWSFLKDTVRASAEAGIGRRGRCQSDWFIASSVSLDPLLRERSELYRRWVASGLRSVYLAFADARRQARGAVRSAKENWIASHAAFVESGRFSGRHAWSAVGEIQRCLASLPPRPVCSIKDDNGNLCLPQDSQTARWH